MLFVVVCRHGVGQEHTIDLAKYNIPVMPDSNVLQRGTALLADSLVRHNPMLNGHILLSDIQHEHAWQSQTTDFYLLLSLCLLLGVIRFGRPALLPQLVVGLWNPTLSNRQLKDQLQGAGLPNLLMNVFFTISVGSYIYYVVKFYTPHHSGVIPSSLLIIMLIAGTAIIYTAKYLAVRFSGWRQGRGVTEHYLFNVFLINKILAIVLIPFINYAGFCRRGSGTPDDNSIVPHWGFIAAQQIHQELAGVRFVFPI